MRTAIVAALALMLVAPPSASAAELTELALLPGDRSGSAYGVNDHGIAVGNSYNRDPRAVRWTADGTVEQLPLPAGATASQAYAINNAGVVVGAVTQSGRRGAFRWNADGTVTDLGTLGGSAAEANSVNASGVAAGMSYTGRFDQRGVRWEADGTAVELPPLPGDVSSYAYGINADGVVVGSSTSSGYVSRPVRWNPDGTVVALSSSRGAALGISDAGVITGYAGGAYAPARWDVDGTETMLPLPSGHAGGSARITAGGVPFGGVRKNGEFQATVWGDSGPVLLGNLPGGKGSVVLSLNASGVATGWAWKGDVQIPYRWS